MPPSSKNFIPGSAGKKSNWKSQSPTKARLQTKQDEWRLSLPRAQSSTDPKVLGVCSFYYYCHTFLIKDKFLLWVICHLTSEGFLMAPSDSCRDLFWWSNVCFAIMLRTICSAQFLLKEHVFQFQMIDSKSSLSAHHGNGKVFRRHLLSSLCIM